MGKQKMNNNQKIYEKKKKVGVDFRFVTMLQKSSPCGICLMIDKQIYGTKQYSDIDSHIYGQLIFAKCKKQFSGGRAGGARTIMCHMKTTKPKKL